MTAHPSYRGRSLRISRGRMRPSSGMASVARCTIAHNEYPVLRRFIHFDTYAVYFFLIMPHPENRAGSSTDYNKPSFAGSFYCLLNIIRGGGKEEGATGMENADCGGSTQPLFI
jgi:hypothetical protein